jgi:hypothetical protein
LVRQSIGVGLVHLERNRYSVPAAFANRPVSVRVYPERIVAAAAGQIVCELSSPASLNSSMNFGRLGRHSW